MMTLDNIHDRINFRGMLSQFLSIMEQRFAESIRKRRVGSSKGAKGRLIASFKKAMFYTGGDVNRASLTFLKYGRMVDMGVGKGTDLTERLNNRRSAIGRIGSDRNPRRRKPWYSKTKAHELHRFRELMLAQFGRELLNEVEQTLTEHLN